MKTTRLFLIFILIMLTGCNPSVPDKNNAASLIPDVNTSDTVSTENAEEVVQESETEPIAAEPVTGNCDNDYYPVKTGVSWDYAISSSISGDNTFTRSITDVHDTGFSDLDIFSVGTERTGTWTCDSGNITALNQGGAATVSIPAEAGVPVFEATSQESNGVTYPASLDVGQSWNQDLVISGDLMITEGMTTFATNETSNACTVIGEESVSVPAGTFTALKADCSTTMIVTVEIEGVATDPVTINSTSEMWLVKGVGMVKIVESNNLGDSSIELTSYSIP
ncbi:MAG: hypothetical protein JEZ00_16775 [Anaerolineaceae bacterium]|nr:hypothetical protein [Anaerolineaceae bacterium]